MRTTNFTRQFNPLILLIAVSFFARSLVAQISAPPNNTILHVFQGGTNDGLEPAGGVVFDSKGNLYGATTYGGSGGTNCVGQSCGTVYQLVPPAQPDGAWIENILYNFTGITNHQDGELPSGNLTIDSTGNLYGVTAYGGTGGCTLLGAVTGCGIVYELSPPSAPGGAWRKTTIYSFQGGLDGDVPFGSLIFDKAGNMYGVTVYGGGFGVCNAGFYLYCGTVFKLTPPNVKGGTWTEQVLHSFRSGQDGATPYGGLILDEHGVIYGTTLHGGTVIDFSPHLGCAFGGGGGCGTVFALYPPVKQGGTWTESVLHRFLNVPDGGGPNAGLVIDETGNLFGTTSGGGADEFGTMFEVSPPTKPGAGWKETVILSVASAMGILLPQAGLTLKDGTFYGTAIEGGSFQAGAVFRVEASTDASNPWNASVLCNFAAGNQGEEPQSQLTFDSSGAMYGTTAGYNHQITGAVFRIGK